MQEVSERCGMTVGRQQNVTSTAVVGAGDMGAGIAAVSALNGYDVTVYDVDEEQLAGVHDDVEWSYDRLVDKDRITGEEATAALDRIDTTPTIEDAVEGADLVTEAVVEQLSVKEGVFETMDQHAPDHAILATNTSGLSVTALAEATDRPEQVIGTHWFNPPMLMDLVELVHTEYTSEQVAARSRAFVESLGKTPIVCRRDVPKFIVNRCMRAYDQSAAWLAYFGVADFREIDSAMKYREDFPMGPFELADYLGAIQHRVEGEQDLLEDSRPLSYDTRICPLLHERYEQGDYGRKTGKGYYEYGDDDGPDLSEAAGEEFDTLLVWAPVINEAAKMIQHDVASVEDVDEGMRLGGNWPIGPLRKADEVGLERVTKKCVEVAGIHERIENVAETLPCDLLVEKAKAGETFY